LNDIGDVVYRIKPESRFLKKAHIQGLALQYFNDESNNEGDEEPMEKCSLLFFVPGPQSDKKPFLCFDSPYDKMPNLRGITLNAKYLFMWNDGNVWKISLDDPKQERIKLQLYVSEDEKQTKIKKVRTGSNPEFICIRVNQTPTNDCIIQWHVKKDLEVNSFDVSVESLFFQDHKGNFYLAEKDVLVMI
jgi:hypothetical protein